MSPAILEAARSHSLAFDPANDYADRVEHTSSDSQKAWAETPLKQRLRIVKGARHRIAANAQAFAAAISPELSRTAADTIVAEILPLLAAAQFLEQQASDTLRVRALGRKGLPRWLSGIDSEIHRVPFGRILVIGPANYPLFLPGVQTLQALAAGNAVVWKPGHGGQPVAELFADAMYVAGLPRHLLRITEDSVEAAEQQLVAGADKVFFTGSLSTGRALLQQLSTTCTPSVVELSGCDAVIALPSADLSHLVKALTLGMRLNGSATCMAPRRILLLKSTPERKHQFIDALLTSLSDSAPVTLSETTRLRLKQVLSEATLLGAKVHGSVADRQRPILVSGVKPDMQLAQSDIFAPLISIIDVEDEAAILAAQRSCPFALTVSIFGEENARLHSRCKNDHRLRADQRHHRSNR
jgi:acyl-CoA reductase-like NAD-dependent aldehyde dehydrogenase